MSSFEAQLKAFADKTKEQLDDVVALTVFKMAESVILRSPVGDGDYWKHPPPKGYVGGHFRANWRLGIGEKPEGIVPNIDPSGGHTIATIQAAIPEEAAGKTYFIANNLPYAQRLEEGWSRQAPEGMVGLTLLQFDNVIATAVQESKK